MKCILLGIWPKPWFCNILATRSLMHHRNFILLFFEEESRYARVYIHTCQFILRKSVNWPSLFFAEPPFQNEWCEFLPVIELTKEAKWSKKYTLRQKSQKLWKLKKKNWIFGFNSKMAKKYFLLKAFWRENSKLKNIEKWDFVIFKSILKTNEVVMEMRSLSRPFFRSIFPTHNNITLIHELCSWLDFLFKLTTHLLLIRLWWSIIFHSLQAWKLGNPKTFFYPCCRFCNPAAEAAM